MDPTVCLSNFSCCVDRIEVSTDALLAVTRDMPRDLARRKRETRKMPNDTETRVTSLWSWPRRARRETENR
jgi:hypothetical protein